MFKNSILDETNEELEAFVAEITATMEGDQTLAIPGHFELQEEDSEDHLYPKEESEQAGEQEQEEGALTGNQ